MTDASRDADLVWLKEIERRIDKGLPFDSRAMLVALRDALPRGFKPSDITGRLMYGNVPSLEGLQLLGDRTGVLPDVTKTILYIQKRLIEYPSLMKVTAAEVAEALKVSTERAERLLLLVGSVGQFCSGASGSAHGYSEIHLDRDDVVAQYLGFRTLEELMEERARAAAQGMTLTYKMPVEHPPKEPGTERAFILMSMDPADASLTDVCNTIKAVCSAYDVDAFRIDDVQHQDTITEMILSCIRESDFIIADLTGERPNVYYEVGYAHAVGKRPILYRRKDTRLHFDLSVHNVPEYRNMTELSALLHKRLEAVLGRSSTGNHSSQIAVSS